MEAFKRAYLILRPLTAGASGFARLELHADRALLQWQGKGLKTARVRVFAYGGEGAAREVGAASVDAHGQASLLADMPTARWGLQKLTAVLAVSDERAPKPLLMGLCQPGAGAQLDARNALLALCARLTEAQRGARDTPGHVARKAVEAKREDAPPPEPPPQTVPEPPVAESAPESSPEIPTEVFLPALDPRVYIPAELSRADASLPALAGTDAICAAAPASPADRPRPLAWPGGLESLALYFEQSKPFAPFDAPGWRFVRVPMRTGFFAVGRLCVDGRVRQIAYALPGSRDSPPPPELGGYRFLKAVDGQGYWVCWQRVAETTV